MKRVKVMLAAIAVIAVVGGALAFKALKFDGKVYCTVNYDPGVSSQFCPNVALTTIATDLGGHQQIRYIQVNNQQECQSSPACTLTAFTNSGE